MTLAYRLTDRLAPRQANAQSLARLLEESGLAFANLRRITGGAYTLEVVWNEALPAWRTLRSLTGLSGLYPLLVESEAELEGIARARQTPALLSGAPEAQVVLSARLRAVAARHEHEVFPPQGEWPEESFDASEEYYYTLHYRFESAPRTMLVALVPTVNPWEAPALLGFGGWETCPCALEHAGVLRAWFERHGAEPILLTRDVLELRVAAPPQTEDAALELAQQQFAYCDDIVYQGTGTLEALAATLLGTPTWYFWWDSRLRARAGAHD